MPPYAIVVGANKLIRYRFSRNIIDKLLKIRWWNWDDEKIKKSFKYFSDPQKFIDIYYGENEAKNE